MSRIAALLVLYAMPAGAAPVTAERALAASRAVTSIGRDPCRGQATGDEIVVCGRRESPYSLPLYEPAARDEMLTGRGREDVVENMHRKFAPCNARGEACLKPLPLLRIGPDGLVVGKD